jgi:hypothetical protein
MRRKYLYIACASMLVVPLVRLGAFALQAERSTHSSFRPLGALRWRSASVTERKRWSSEPGRVVESTSTLEAESGAVLVEDVNDARCLDARCAHVLALSGTDPKRLFLMNGTNPGPVVRAEHDIDAISMHRSGWVAALGPSDAISIWSTGADGFQRLPVRDAVLPRGYAWVGDRFCWLTRMPDAVSVTCWSNAHGVINGEPKRVARTDDLWIAAHAGDPVLCGEDAPRDPACAGLTRSRE